MREDDGEVDTESVAGETWHCFVSHHIERLVACGRQVPSVQPSMQKGSMDTVGCGVLTWGSCEVGIANTGMREAVLAY
jgi:hypothetical protein